MADKKPTYAKRTKRQYADSAKKAQRTRRANLRKGTTAKKATPATRKKRRAPAKKKGPMLSELFNPKMAEAGGRALLSGAVGGIVAGGVDKFMQNQTPIVRNITKIGLSFVAATVFKMQNVGAGIAGATLYQGMNNSGMLAENGLYLEDHRYAQDIKQLPMVLNENGDEMFLEQEGDALYLEQNDEGVYSYDVGYFEPGFGM